MTDAPDDAATPGVSESRADRRFTVPNLLCATRIAGAPVLVGLAVTGQHEAFVWLFIGLLATDWIDGKLAVLLKQRSVLGARLDSWADVSLYGALLIGAVWLYPETLRQDWLWIGSAGLSYAMSVACAWKKFRRWPSYHTRLAKSSWMLFTFGMLSLIAGWTPWLFRAAMVSIVITNMEHLLMTRFLREWKADAGSLRRVLNETQAARKPDASA